jgi:hypothetical protein
MYVFLPFKIVQTPGLVVILHEASTGDFFRQIFTDGRELPTNPNPTWRGYSVGRWDGDTLVVDVAGFNGETWIGPGYPHTDALHIIERFRRRDVGHLEIEIVVDDPRAYTSPWTIKLTPQLVPDTELLEGVCEK